MAGRYAANGALAFTIAVTDGRIEYSKPFRQPVELIAVGDRRFIARDSGAAYTFAADGQTATITAPPGIPAPAMGLGDLGAAITAHFTINFLNLHYIVRVELPPEPAPAPEPEPLERAA